MHAFLKTAVLMAPSLAYAAGPHPWRPVPSVLWAAQAFVPPGTNDTRAVQVVPSGVPIAIPVGPGGGVAVGGASPVGGGGPGVLPPGIPAGVSGSSGSSGTSGAGSGAVSGSAKPSVAAPSSASAAIVPKAVSCEVSLRLGRTDLPHTGGEFQVPVILKPAGCPASVATAAPWIRMIDAGTLKLSAEPNLSAATREAMVLVGERSYFVRQAAAPQPGLAAAPGRLVFAVNRKGESGSKVLTIWSDRAGASFKARSTHPWLSIAPRKGEDGRQSYEVSMQPGAALPPGTHDATIELSVTGAQGHSVLVPVVVEVEGRLY